MFLIYTPAGAPSYVKAPPRRKLIDERLTVDITIVGCYFNVISNLEPPPHFGISDPR
jgi:hypothetical protein